MSGGIFIFTRALPMHRLGGMEQMAWDLARALARLGAAVTVVTTSIFGRPAAFVEDGVEVVALPVPAGRYSAAWWAASRAFLAARAPGEVAAVLSVSAAGFGLLRLKRRFANTRFVMQAHGTSADEIRSKWRGGWRARLSSLRNVVWLPRDLLAYRRFDLVVAVGDAVAASLGKPPVSLVLPEGRRRLIRNGVDTELFAPNAAARDEVRARYAVPDAAAVVLSANRLHPQKGGAAALRAFARFAATVSDARYWIAGEGPELAALTRLAQELGVAARVKFLGRLFRNDLAAHLAAADVFLLLGDRIEVGLPLNVLEALAAGLPVVLSRHLARSGVPGLFAAAPEDADAAAAQLARAAASARRDPLLPPGFGLTECARAFLKLLDPES